MATRNVYYSPQLNEYYFGESFDFLSKLEKLNSGYYDTVEAISKANDWEVKLVIECESKSQAVKILKHISSRPNALYLNNLSIHPGVIQRLLERFSETEEKEKSFSLGLDLKTMSEI